MEEDDNEKSMIQMEKFMQDRPLPDISVLREFEKKYLIFSLDIMDTRLRAAYVKSRDKDSKLQLLHQEEWFGPFTKSTLSKYNTLLLQLHQEKFKHLLKCKWDWDAYFADYCIDDYYVRWFFI